MDKIIGGNLDLQLRKDRKNIFLLFFLFTLIVTLTITTLSVFSQDLNENSGNLRQPIYIAEFFEPGCHDCERAEQLLNQIAFEYPELEIRKFDMSTPEGVALAEEEERQVFIIQLWISLKMKK